MRDPSFKQQNEFSISITRLTLRRRSSSVEVRKRARAYSCSGCLRGGRRALHGLPSSCLPFGVNVCVSVGAWRLVLWCGVEWWGVIVTCGEQRCSMVWCSVACRYLEQHGVLVAWPARVAPERSASVGVRVRGQHVPACAHDYTPHVCMLSSHVTPHHTAPTVLSHTRVSLLTWPAYGVLCCGSERVASFPS